MKVFENIDNYDFFPAYEMSEEDEERFIGDLKKIVTDLIPLRGNKRKTRQYFTKYLRLDYNIRQHEFRHTEYTMEGPVCEKYVPQPGEYDWESDKLQPALIEVLDNDKYSFGHIVNLLNYDIADRRDPGKWDWDQISDAAVEYNLKFDFDDIQEKVDSLQSFKEKRDYLNEVNLACQTFGRLTQDEYNEFGQAFEYKLDKLIDKVKEEQEIWGDSKPLVKEVQSPEPQSSEPVEISLTPHQFKGEKLSDDGVVLSDVYYSPEVLGTGQFDDIVFEIDFDDDYRQQYYSKSFSSVLKNYFDASHFEENGIVYINSNTLEDASKMVANLLLDYCRRLYALYSGRDDRIPRKLTNWLKETVSLINKSYSKNPKYYPADNIDQDTGYPSGKYYSNDFIRDILLEQAYDSYSRNSFLHFASLESISREVMPYNLWGSGYDDDFEKYHGLKGLTDENRAKAYLRANEERFEKEIKSYCHVYEEQCSSNLPFGDEDINDYHPNTHIPSFLQSLFSDYVRRVNDKIKDAIIADTALQSWAFNLICKLTRYYQEEYERLNESKDDNVIELSCCSSFYLEYCLPTATNILHNYYIDSEEIALLKKKSCSPSINQAAATNSVTPENEGANLKDITDSPLSENPSPNPNSQTPPQGLLSLFKERTIYESIIAFLQDRIGNGFSAEKLTYFQALYESGLTFPFKPADIFSVFPHLSDHAQQYSKYVGDSSEFNKKGKRGRENRHRKTIDSHIEELKEIAKEAVKNSENSVEKTVNPIH